MMAKPCPQCGAPIQNDGDLCPKCLLAVGLGTENETAATLPVHRGAAINFTPRSGETFGPYRIDALLGEGGMGKVYDAVHLEDGRRVALKVLSHGLDSPEARQRFLREGRLAASVNHPHCVYIFGTEEIHDMPAITMELVAEGTLEERVKQDGPMSVGDAVDSILQVIDGLEAADAIGILHRDVKPSNCFVDADGSVKVGDFGLSISTIGRAGPMVTEAGAFIGTPAFSSPEQIRGDCLDVRSDIYSVGVTLYYLLTGRVPFAAENIGRLLATVLEQKPAPPTRAGHELPRGLCRIVLRCLEKKAGARYQNYAELRDALRPFSTTAPAVASLGRRFWAMAADQIPISLVGLPMLIMYGLENQVVNAVGALVAILYFSGTEWLWGASLGKRLFRLKVTGINGTQASFMRCFVRAFIVSIPSFLSIMIPQGDDVIMLAWTVLVCLLYPLLFCTARRHNHFAGLHDLATQTRVIHTPQSLPRLPLAVETEAGANDVAGLPRIGPYHVLETLGATDKGTLILGYDSRLLRKVWIHRLPEGSPPVAHDLRNLGRPGRLRWLTGRRDGNECWDAYEAPSGTPFLDAITTPQSWQVVRGWLLDLAEELQRVGKTDKPNLSLSRVWVTQAGTAKLLDFAIKNDRAISTECPSDATAEAFIRHVAIAALNGLNKNNHDAGTTLTKPIPLHAQTLLGRLDDGINLQAWENDLRAAQQKTAEVTRSKRAEVLFLCFAFPLSTIIFMPIFYTLGRHANVAEHSVERMQLHALLEMHELYSDWDDLRLLEIYVVSRYRPLMEAPSTWQETSDAFTCLAHYKAVGQELLVKHANITAADREAAMEMAIEYDLQATMKASDFTKLSSYGPYLLIFIIAFVALPSLVLAFVMRRGLVLALCRIVVVNADGSQVSRLRALWRATIIWSPMAVPLCFFSPDSPPSWILVTTIGLIALAFVSVLISGKSIADRLSGTCLVPK